MSINRDENKQPTTSGIKKEDVVTDLQRDIEAAGDTDNELSWVPIFKRVETKTKRCCPGKVRHGRFCTDCGKGLSSRSSLCRHKKSCKEIRKHVKPSIMLNLKWNGESWETKAKNLRYRMNLGRDLSNLLERGAIKEDTLNSTQKEYIRMYKSLFLD